MSLRALGSLLTRRFAPRGSPRAQAESSPGIGINKAPGSAAGRPVRSLQALVSLRYFHPATQVSDRKFPSSACTRRGRNLAVGDGRAYGAAATAALAGLVALLYFNRDTEKPAGEVTGVEGRKKKVPHKEVVKEWGLDDEEAAKAMFVDKDGKVNWSKYVEYIDTQRYRGGKLYDEEVVSGKEAIDKVTGREAVGLEDLKVDDEAMHARFEDWMKQHGRSYESEEEKARDMKSSRRAQ